MMRYGTLDSSGRPVYAGTTLVVDGVPYANAAREMWLAAGKKPFLGSGANPPKSKREGWHYERDGWQEQAAAFVPKWKLVEDATPPPRVWTPLAIKRACGERWTTIHAALEAAGIFEDFVMAQELREDDAAFQMGYQWAVMQYGQEAVDAVLAAAKGGM